VTLHNFRAPALLLARVADAAASMRARLLQSLSLAARSLSTPATCDLIM